VSPQNKSFDMAHSFVVNLGYDDLDESEFLEKPHTG